jgi:hypothetical protein
MCSIVFSETSVRKYQSTLLQIPKDRRSHWHGGWSLKLPIALLKQSASVGGPQRVTDRLLVLSQCIHFAGLCLITNCQKSAQFRQDWHLLAITLRGPYKENKTIGWPPQPPDLSSSWQTWAPRRSNNYDIANVLPNNVLAPAEEILHNDRCCIQTFI